MKILSVTHVVEAERLMMSELKPCPFCGEQPETSKGYFGSKERLAFCRNCGTDNDPFTYPEWNTRPIEDEIITELNNMYKDTKVEIARLSEDLKLYVDAAMEENAYPCEKCQQFHTYGSPCPYTDEQIEQRRIERED